MFDSVVTDFVLWGLVGAVVLAGLAAVSSPVTRPYAKKYGWLIVSLLLGLLLLIFFRKRPGRGKSGPSGQDLASDGSAVIQAAIDHAEAQSAKVDAELAAKRIASEQERREFEVRLADAQKIQDSAARRQALIDLVDSQRKTP